MQHMKRGWEGADLAYHHNDYVLLSDFWTQLFDKNKAMYCLQQTPFNGMK